MSAPPLWNRYRGRIDDASAATISYLTELNVAAAPRSVAGYITAHPAYPRLGAIVDCLGELGVRASACRFAFDALPFAPNPALVPVEDGAKSTLWVLNGHSDGHFDCTLPGGRRRRIPADELRQRYQGVIVSGVADAQAGERRAERNEREDRLRGLSPLVALALGAVALVGTCTAASLGPGHVAGAALAFCLAGWLGLALSTYLGEDAAVACFTGQLLAGGAAALTGSLPAFLLANLVLGVVVVPIVVYSLVQRASVSRRPSATCLALNAVLGAELAVAAQATGFDWTVLGAVDGRAGALVTLAGLLGALTSALFRPLIRPALSAPRLEAELERLRNVPDVLAAAFARTRAVPTDLPGKVRRGDRAAPIEILVVLDPFCVACADAHTAIRRLVDAFPRLVRSATVFSVPEANRAASSAARSLLSGTVAIDDWYARPEENVAEWLLRGDHAERAREQRRVLAAQTAFARLAGVRGAPAIFVDGKRLPPGFELRHLRHYLEAERRKFHVAVPPVRVIVPGG